MTYAKPQPGQDPDEATIEACRRGDRAALGLVFRRYSPAIEGLVYRLVGPRADVEDLLQSTLLAAMGAFPRFRGMASVKTWMCRIAVHVVHEHLRRPERKRRVSLDVLQGDAEPVSPASSPEARTDARRRAERLYELLDTLSPDKRVAFVLFTFDERSIEEVAALVGASRAATKTRIFMARRELMALVSRDPALRDLLQTRGEP